MWGTGESLDNFWSSVWMIWRLLSNILIGGFVAKASTSLRSETSIFDRIIGYEGIKRTFLRSLNSKEPVHILLVGPPGQAKTLFLKCILGKFRKETFFTVGGNASKSGIIDVLFDLRPKYLLIDEIEHLRSGYLTILLSLMEAGTLTQTLHNKVRQAKYWYWLTKIFRV